MFAKVRDTRLFFDIDGASLVPDGAVMRERSTAFLVGGGPGVDHSAYKPRYGVLANKMQLVYFDHRGHGRSARGDVAKYNLDENVEDMEALRRYLGLGPIVSLGASYGGVVAMAHAARYPTSVSHLILIATYSHAGYASRAMKTVTQIGTDEQIALCDDLFAGRIDSPERLKNFQEKMGNLYSKKFDLNAAVPGLGRGILSIDAQNIAHGPGGFLRTFDLRPELRNIRAPTLVLAGKHDWICPPEFSVEIQDLIAGSDLRIFENSSHSLASDEPENLFDAIAGFLVYQQ